MSLRFPVWLLPLLTPLALAQPASAQTAASTQEASAEPMQPTLVAPPAFQTMLWDEAEDGTWWARARRYKLQITGDEVSYIPRLGSRAPHNFPLTLRPVELRIGTVSLPLGTAQRERTGDTVTLDRGALREVWRLDLDTAEQDFVIDAAGQNADILVRLAVETACGTPTADPDGSLYFPAESHGGVRYGHTIVLDRAGHRLEQPSRWNDGCIELTVPAAFVREAIGPITIDPVIQTISIDTSPGTQHIADVAYVSGPDVWLAVYEEVVSANDTDVISRRFTKTGAFLDEVAVDIGNTRTFDAVVAGNRARSQFLVVWNDNSNILPRQLIRGRIRAAANSAQLPTFTLDSVQTNIVNRPDVGGSLSTTGSDFCVVWDFFNVGVGGNVRYAVVTAGSPGPVQILSASGSHPAISKTSGTGRTWLACFRAPGSFAVDVFCRIIDDAGNTVGSATFVGDTDSSSTIDVTGDGVDFLVVWNHPATLISTLTGRRVRLINVPTMVSPQVDLITSQTGANPNVSHFHPRVAGGGCRYVLTYEEDAIGAGNREIFAATMAFDTTPIFIDSHVSLSTVPGAVDNGGIAMTTDTGDPGSPIAMATFSSVNVFGSLIDMLDPTGGISVLQTGCGGLLNEPTFTGTGAPALGGHVVLNLGNLTPSSLPFIVLGLPSAPITLCTSGCQQGVNPILASVFGTTHTFNIPCIASLLHVSFAAQGITILSSGLQGACPSTLFGAPFRVSDTLRLTLQ